MKSINNIREFVWPILENAEVEHPQKATVKEILINDKDHIKFALDQALKQYEAEQDRKKTIESKSALFISTSSISTTIILAVTTMFINNNVKSNFTSWLMASLIFAFVLYIVRTIWYAVKAMERKNYQVLTAEDFYTGKDDTYYKELIIFIQNVTVSNYPVINNKVDNFVMAQEYFKRAMVLVAVYSFIMLLFFFTK